MKVISLPARYGAALVLLLLAAGVVAADGQAARAPNVVHTAAASPDAVCEGAAPIASKPEKKGRDGAACSSSDECVNTCEGGSCCTAHDDVCNSSSHCCGHQSCTNGKCP